jgi:rhodanese-related sulfurtransferase
MHLLTASQLSEILDKGSDNLIIDIRESYELDNDKSPFMHIPMAEIPFSKSSFNEKFKKIVLVCQSGRRAEASANFIETEFGLNNVYVLEGGMCAWQEFTSNTINS